MTQAPPTEEAIFQAALEKPTRQERVAYVEGALAGDEALRQRVLELLASHDASRGPLDMPPTALGATIDGFSERPGSQIGPYKLLQQIGEGGMGVVYLAEQLEPVKRRVALKIIKPGMDTRQVIARFEAERQALSLMDHPNIAKVLDAGTTESGRPYFVMELVKGEPITQYCDEHHLTPRQRLELLLPVCQAIQHAHQKGIIHRDIKPTNILVAEYDQKAVPKVIDFGVAKATSQTLTEKTMFTGFGQIVGTLEYMSPEQAKVNQLDIDTRSDIYSLGVLLYELLTGSTPFDKERLRSAGWDEMLRIIREEEPEKPSTRLSSVGSAHDRSGSSGEVGTAHPTLASIAAVRGTEPARLTKLVRGELDWIVMKALEKDRNRRYETADALAMDVQRYLADEPVQACPPSAGYRLRKFVRRNKRGLMSVAVVAVAVVLAAASAGWAWRDRAVQQATIAGRVDQILDESEALYQQRKLPDATQIARNALALAEGGAGDSELARRARDWLKDLDMVARLEEIGTDSDRDPMPIPVAYGQAFREYGIDIEALTPEEAAARIASRPIRVDLATALDRWGNVVRRKGVNLGDWGLDGEKGVALRARLRRIARLADPDEVRDRLRGLYAGNGPLDDPELVAIADKIDLDSTPIPTLMAIGDALEWPEQISFYTRVQQQHPNDFAVTYELGYKLFWSAAKGDGDLDSPIRFLTAAVAIRPRSRGARQLLAHALRNKGYVDEAIAAYRAADRVNARPIHQIDIGGLLLQAGREQAAAAEFREALRLTADPAEVHLGIGRAYAEARNYDDAIVAHREAIRLKADYAYGHHSLGFALEQKGCVDEAIAAHREAVRLSPDIAEYYNSLGFTLQKAGRGDEAIAAYREAARLEPEIATYHQNLANALGRKKEFDASIVAFRETIRLAPNDADAHVALGNVLHSKGLVDDAIVAYREALRLKPNDPDVRKGLGLALKNKSILIEAIAAYSEAVRLAPDDADAHLGLGTALQAKGLVDDAIGEYREAGRLQPDMALAHHWLGTALEKKGLVDDAIAAHREASRLQPDEALFHWWLGTALDKKGLVDDAVAPLRAAIGIQPDSPKFHFALGAAHGHAGQWKPAAAAYARGLELDKNPNNHSYWYTGLPLHLAAGDAEGYRRLCRQMLERFGQSQDLITIEWTAKTCALVPDAVSDFKPIEKLADQLVTGTETHGSYRFFVLVKALVEYRAGRHAEAVQWAERYAPVPDGNEFDACVFATLSMAEHQLGNADKARAALTSAKAIVTNKRPDPANGRPFVNWHEWLHSDTVLREAEVLVKEK
jgi:tetratricopeptide (TPR) repeat protein/tRNA A-37 threonylcarbamoyl transferase component Bud32